MDGFIHMTALMEYPHTLCPQTPRSPDTISIVKPDNGDWTHMAFDRGEVRDAKAFPDDNTELDDPWIFVDFSRRIGITYPQAPTDPACRSLAVQLLPRGPTRLPYDISTY